MTACELILQGISDGDTIGGPFAMASLVAKTLSNDPFDMDALDQAYMDYYESGFRPHSVTTRLGPYNLEK